MLKQAKRALGACHGDHLTIANGMHRVTITLLVDETAPPRKRVRYQVTDNTRRTHSAIARALADAFSELAAYREGAKP